MRLIDADAKECWNCLHYDFWGGCGTVCIRKKKPFNDGVDRFEKSNRFDKALTIDPVKQGKWKFVDNKHSQCTQCKTIRNIETQYGWDFCPNCGAKMDGDAE